jgi:hypothetical protein
MCDIEKRYRELRAEGMPVKLAIEKAFMLVVDE